MIAATLAPVRATCQVLEDETGEAGLRTATLRQIDLIVLDLNLPDMDGASIVERIRSWSAVPIIVLSVRASEDDKYGCSKPAPTTMSSRRSACGAAGPRAHRVAAPDATRSSRAFC